MALIRHTGAVSFNFDNKDINFGSLNKSVFTTKCKTSNFKISFLLVGGDTLRSTLGTIIPLAFGVNSSEGLREPKNLTEGWVSRQVTPPQGQARL